ncbi:9003_t:CDS:1, partial [Funneliformis geosporum]
ESLLLTGSYSGSAKITISLRESSNLASSHREFTKIMIFS